MNQFPVSTDVIVINRNQASKKFFHTDQAVKLELSKFVQTETILSLAKGMRNNP